MASVDLKDAYYSIPVAVEHRKYLMFEWQGSYFQFTCLPNGLSCAPRLFTKILKPIYAHLRVLGYTCMGHIDDSLLVAFAFNDCKDNVAATVGLFTKLGFPIHPDKSILEPTQEIEFLGFLINSLSMTVRLSATKAAKVKSDCQELLGSGKTTIRQVAHVIGVLVSSLPAVQYGALHYRKLELGKTQALRENYGNFDAFMTLSEDAKTELLWWIDNIMCAQKVLITPSPEIILTTDASNIGWGAVLRDQQTGGHWSPQEQEFHINYLELKAVLLGLKSLCSKCTATHIRVQSDNTTAVAYINSMGGIKSESCNDMASQIWEWCITKQIWLSACHIPGAELRLTLPQDNLRTLLNGLYQQKCSSQFSRTWGPLILTYLHQG